MADLFLGSTAMPVTPQDTPAANSTLLDATTQGLINNQINRAANENYQGQVTNGIESAKGLLRQPSQITDNANALGMKLPSDFAQTVGNRQSGYFNDTIASLKTKAALEAPIYQKERQNQISQNLAGSESLRVANYKLLNDQYLQQVALAQANQGAKNQMIGSILGLVGAGVGFAASGFNPVGAVAGAGVGSAVGGALAKH